MNNTITLVWRGDSFEPLIHLWRETKERWDDPACGRMIDRIHSIQRKPATPVEAVRQVNCLQCWGTERMHIIAMGVFAEYEQWAEKVRAAVEEHP